MKKLISIAVFALATVVSAQSPVNVGGSNTGGRTKTTTAAQDALNIQGRDLDNFGICGARGISKANCTQANLNALPGCANGACGIIYPSTPAGAGDYGLDSMFACHFERLEAKVKEINIRDLVALTIQNGSLVASNTECANAVGGTLGNGCTRFQIQCRAASGGTSSDCK